jgi:O-methyltransferase involved in polyketide biosynthesis
VVLGRRLSATAGRAGLWHSWPGPPELGATELPWSSFGDVVEELRESAPGEVSFPTSPLANAPVSLCPTPPAPTHQPSALHGPGAPQAVPPLSYVCRLSADASLISVTAKVAAYYRQFSDIQFAAEVARRIGADEVFERILREHGLERDKLTFYAPMFEARYKSITQVIFQSGASQVLELASGYSLRGLDLTRSHQLWYVETDLPEVVATKLGLLEDLRNHHGISPVSQHVVTAADALDFEQVRAATAVFDRRRPLTVLCEGLIMYLSKSETERLAMIIHGLLSEFAGGCWITPDFSFQADAVDLPPERVRLREAITGVTQRQVDASAFEDERDLAAFLNRSGFNVQVRSQVDETPSFSSIQSLGLSPALIGRLRPVLRLWVMTSGRG